MMASQSMLDLSSAKTMSPTRYSCRSLGPGGGGMLPGFGAGTSGAGVGVDGFLFFFFFLEEEDGFGFDLLPPPLPDEAAGEDTAAEHV